MKRFIKNLLLQFIVLTLAISCSFAAEKADSFSVEISDTINLWEAVDFTIAAIKDWEIFQDYSGMIFIWIRETNWNFLSEDYYNISNEWRYQFLETDQWKKTFSKWLQITKAWTYIIQIEDPSDSGKWEATIVVEWENKPTSSENISISYPVTASIESKPYLTVLWSCEKLKNSPVILYLNDKVAGSWYTDWNWDFSVFVWDLLSWNNEIQAKIVDINNIVLWESAVISVTYKSTEDWVFSWISILPGKEWKQWDTFVFNVYTDDTVNSAQLIFSNWLKYTMDRVWQWLFSKELVVTFFWNIDISLSLIENSNEKIYEKVDKISIEQNASISNIKFTSTGVDWTKVIISRETIWSVDKYQINYGTWKDDLNTSEIVSTSTILIDNLKNDTSYYFQIIPMDSEAHNSGDPSEIVEYHSAAITCIVKWIKVRKEQIWDNHYLVWDPVANVTLYEVYKSDWADMTDARLVWSLTGTRFQYLFDKDATKDEYAYYQVQAICPDWTTVIIDKAQKVKVWPVENILLIIIISIFIYSLYRLHKISDREVQ